MNRLIDADDFEKFIKEKYKDGESTDDIKDQMLFDLSYQPTAYDVDKVIEQLESLSNAEADYYYASSNDVIDRDDAIEIVKGGGVDA